MSDQPAPVRVLAFASPEVGLWGGLIAADGGSALVLGAGDAREASDDGVVLQAGDATWTLSAPGAELTVSPAPPAGDREAGGDGATLGGPHTGDPDLGEPAQPCSVRGQITVGGTSIELDCPGLRFSVDVDDPRDGGSLRAVTSWFGPELSVALGALRPRRSRGHEHDRITATLLQDGRPRMVDEPRLSTTVGEDGVPARMSMELWVAEGDDLYPRRAAGEASAPGARTPRLAAVPMTCHMAGQDGVGVYLLAQLA